MDQVQEELSPRFLAGYVLATPPLVQVVGLLVSLANVTQDDQDSLSPNNALHSTRDTARHDAAMDTVRVATFRVGLKTVTPRWYTPPRYLYWQKAENKY